MKKLIALLRRWMATRRRSNALAEPSWAELDRVNAELAALANSSQGRIEKA
jgi:hypothetical protein